VDGSKPVGLLLPRIYTGYQVYANGKLIGGSGSIIPTVAPALAANPKLFRFHPGDAGPQTVQIAIRVWEYRPIVSWVGGGTLRAGSAAGDPELLEQRLHWIVAEQQSLLVNSYAYGLLATVVGLTILTLFLLHREDREYLWFSMLLLAGAADAMLNVQGFSDAYPFLLFRLTDEVLVAISALAALLFFSTVLKTHRPAERKTAKTAVTTKFLRRIVCSKNEDTPKIGAWFRRKSGNAASFFGSILYSRYIPAVSWPIGK